MTPGQIVVLVWLALPIIIGAINYYQRRKSLGKHTARTTGRVTDIYLDGGAMVTYAFTVAGSEYSATDTPTWGKFLVGDAVNIHYDPKMPADSMLPRPVSIYQWVMLGLLWLSLSLGGSYFIIYIGVFFLSMIGLMYKVIPPYTVRLGFYYLLFALFFVFMGYLFIAFGVDTLRVCGFTGQNWFWSIWFHTRYCIF